MPLEQNTAFGPLMRAVDLIAGESIRRSEILRQQKARRQQQKLGLLGNLQNLSPEGQGQVFDLQKQIISDPDVEIPTGFRPERRTFNIPPAIREKIGLTQETGTGVGETTFKQLTPSSAISKLMEPGEPTRPASEFVSKMLGIAEPLTMDQRLEAERAATQRFSAFKRPEAKAQLSFKLSSGQQVSGSQADNIVDFIEDQLNASKALIEKSKLVENIEFNDEGRIKSFGKKKVGGNVREVAEQFNKMFEIRGKILRGQKLTQEDERLIFGGKGVFQPVAEEAQDINQHIFGTVDGIRQQAQQLLGTGVAEEISGIQK